MNNLVSQLWEYKWHRFPSTVPECAIFTNIISIFGTIAVYGFIFIARCFYFRNATTSHNSKNWLVIYNFYSLLNFANTSNSIIQVHIHSRSISTAALFGKYVPKSVPDPWYGTFPIKITRKLFTLNKPIFSFTSSKGTSYFILFLRFNYFNFSRLFECLDHISSIYL